MPRPPVDADVADLRERMSRIETTVTGVYDILKEHVVERKETSHQAEIERKQTAQLVHDELQRAAIKTDAALAAIQVQVGAVDVRVATVEQTMHDYRVGWKVVVAIAGLMSSAAAIIGAMAAKWYAWRY